jgi:hypothetical protein
MTIAGDGHEQARTYKSGDKQLQRILNESTALHLTLVDPADRPPQYQQIMADNSVTNTAMGQFTVPALWEYYDDKVQEHLEKLYQDLVGGSTTTEVVGT